MPTLSAEQIAGYASSAGLSGEPLAISVAIALAESGGRTDAVGDRSLTTVVWGPSVGLWQIRSFNAQRGTGKTRDETANLDPAHNARAMVELSENGTNWRPWSVYTSGRYRAFLGQARMAANNPSGGSNLVPAPTEELDILDGGTWARVGLFLMGGVLVVIALYQATNAGQAISSIAKTTVKARTGVSL